MKNSKRFINFGSIPQFRQTVKDIQHAAQFQGLDNDGDPIYDKSAKMPKIEVTATEKLHGTNGSVCHNNSLGFWVQSRKNIIIPEKDNATCAFTAMQNIDAWMGLINSLSAEYDINLDNNIVSIFFEWGGMGIQKKSALSELSKRAIIFPYFKVSPIDPDSEIPAKWLPTKVDDRWIDSQENNIFNVQNYKTWTFEIDFEAPLLSQNRMIEIVEKEVEPNSPLGQAMGKDGNTGEGIVCAFMLKDVLCRWKIKGTKHSKTRVRTLKPVDEAKEQTKIEFANYACSASRLEQAWVLTFGIENEKLEPTIKATGDFLRNVFRDIIKEESDIMAEKGLEPKEIGSTISKIARRWFMDELDKHAGLK